MGEWRNKEKCKANEMRMSITWNNIFHCYWSPIDVQKVSLLFMEGNTSYIFQKFPFISFLSFFFVENFA